MLVGASILNCDFSQLKTELDSVKKSNYYHIDVMDGNFVDNISFGPDICRVCNDIVEKNAKLDVHLMINNPSKWVSRFNFNKVEYITVHFELDDYTQAIEEVRKIGKKVGLSIKPQTPVEKINDILKDIDQVLLMSVEPGFGGQKFMMETISKIQYLKKIREEKGYKFIVNIDGGINNETISFVKEADMIVVGSYLFKEKDFNKRNAIIEGFQQK